MTAITSIAFDHQQYLGSDAGRHCRRKGRHRQAGRPAWSSARWMRKPYAAIERIARARGAPLIRAADGVAAVARPDTGTIGLRTPVRDYGDVTVGLAGAHQIGNAVVAVRMLELLDERGIAVPPQRDRVSARPAFVAGPTGSAAIDGRSRDPARRGPQSGRRGRAGVLSAGIGIGTAAARVRRDARQGHGGHAEGAPPGRRPADRHPRLESPLRGSRSAR